MAQALFFIIFARFDRKLLKYQKQFIFPTQKKNRLTQIYSKRTFAISPMYVKKNISRLNVILINDFMVYFFQLMYFDGQALF